MGVTNFDEIECDSIEAESADLGAVQADSLSLTTPLAKASINESAKRDQVHFDFNGTLVDGSTNPRSKVMTRAGKVKKAYIAAGTRMVGGTNTLALAKLHAGASSNLLSTATVNPINVPAAADTGEELTLSGTATDLAFAAGDTLRCTLVCGTMSTDGANYTVSLEVEYDDAA